uniref:non-specific serine/threonine protein kinase n=1 Tax=Eptatretus burgeri TaxID=7764 RepID=A0A8C4QJX4_EPTBU
MQEFFGSVWTNISNVLPTSFLEIPSEVIPFLNERIWEHDFMKAVCITGILMLSLAFIWKILQILVVIPIRLRWNIIQPGQSIGDCVILEKIGEGSFGMVYKARNSVSGVKVALKFGEHKEARTEFHQEAVIMNSLCHPNILKMYDSYDVKGHLILGLEFVEGDTLGKYLCQYQKLSERHAWHIMVQMFSAIEHMHDQNIAHLDLKLENVLYCHQHQVKLIDFGLSRFFNPGQKLHEISGTYNYLAPEMLRLGEYEAPQVDIWSLGIIQRKLLMGIKQIPDNTNSFSFSAACESLLNGMICIDPVSRLTIKEIMRHPWLKQFLSTPVEHQHLEGTSVLFFIFMHLPLFYISI